MPSGWRWALGLGLAFLSGVAAMGLLLAPPAVVLVPVALLATTVLALAAGFVLGTEWATLVLAVTLAAGGVMTSVVLVGFSTASTIKGTGWSAIVLAVVFFSLLLGPLIVVLFIGKAVGQARGVPTVHLGPALEHAVGGVPGHRWLPSLALVLAGGFFAGLGISFSVTSPLPNPIAVLTGLLAAVFAVTCLIAALLIRSWWGLVATPLVYLVVAGVLALLTVSLSSVHMADWAAFAGWFALYGIVPAVGLSAIGTSLGMSRARRAGSHPPPGQ